MSEPRAPILEIFSGIQGEGLFVGTRQIFVRFCGCNRRCRYCDTPEALHPSENCTVELAPGERRFRRVANPVALSEVVGAIEALATCPHEFVSLTGGEPLLQADFIAALCPMLPLPIYLETNGTLPEAFRRVRAMVGHVAMDVKLASATGEPTPWGEHRRFVEAADLAAMHLKVVVADATTDEELRRVRALLEGRRLPTVIVLQPVTPGGGAKPPSAVRILKMQEVLMAEGTADVRVIPQVHKLMRWK